jgi:molybdenum cofactor guanylyltransferase
MIAITSGSMHSGAILAGGRATRFEGRDKGALIVEGRTICDRQLAMLSGICDDLLIVGGGRRIEGARLIEDTVPDSGPMGGVHAALEAAVHDAVFVLAGDMPYVTAPFAAYLLQLSRDADFVVPRTERGYHPLCAVYTRACVEPLARRLARRELKMIDLRADVRVRVVAASEIQEFGDCRRLLANVNTPAEYEGLEALRGHKP